MRNPALVVIALVTLSSGLTAQGIRRPPFGGRAPTAKAPLPREMPAVTRALAYKRSRWSAEAYPLISSIQVPAVTGGLANYTSSGMGTRADYRYTDRLSATMDMTASLIGAPLIVETVEVGTRFRPMPWSQDLRPFIDLRAAYMHMSDSYEASAETGLGVGGPNQEFIGGTRYGRGFGAVAGTGLEYSLTRTLSLTTEVSAMRDRMTTYRQTGLVELPDGHNYWLTMFRYTLGLKYNPGRLLHLAQNPGS